MQLSTFVPRNTPRKKTTDAASPQAARRVACPTCSEVKGFLLEVDGAAYRVLEDERDTEMLTEAGGIDAAFVTCSACKTTMRAAAVLEHHTQGQEVEYAADTLVSRRRPQIRMGPRRNRVHRGGRAARRTSADGRQLPMCPECGATHDFFVDLEGAAYRVLEDDQDTDLLGEATNLLCSRCHAVFEL